MSVSIDTEHSEAIERARLTSRLASRPQYNATIRASAGTGKTFLLVTRLVRLLLAGAEPAGLLAITFTRKAAAEMQQRLQQRLLEWLRLDDSTLSQELELIGVNPDAETRQRARQLHEQLLRNDRQPRITTFHAFCQDILRRFPLEADVPPGFALLENTGILTQQAWDALWYDATREPDSPLARALQQLLSGCGGIDSCRRSLFEFLHHRSDWWALSGDDTDGNAVQQAGEKLRQQLEIETDDDPCRLFFDAGCIDTLQAYHDLLILHDNVSNRTMASQIAAIICTLREAADVDYAAQLEQVKVICYTQAGKPRSIKESKARATAMGEAGQQRFLALHAELQQALDRAVDQQRRHQTWQLSTAWYLAGQHLLQRFQRLKLEQRLLDFNDLEWRACCLLNDGSHSHWIQYKLDQRINHILVDEFQDTNPTQWRLLLPLLQELAAHGSQQQERERSVFLVGDDKQSIYRFRRADPRLFDSAREWLAQHLDADEYPLAVSWRSSPAIIDVVNRVFANESVQDQPTTGYLPDFPLHDTHRKELWGQVEMLPLIEADENESDTDVDDGGQSLRNPLQQPRTVTVNEQHLKEGRQISRHIRGLMAANPGLRYTDIMILIRHRTHLHDLEQALREAGIPYLGNGKKTLLDTLEIQDMVALLQALVSPGNNLALAQVLRSPLFDCSDDDLIRIAQQCHRRQQAQHTTAEWMTALLEAVASDGDAASEALTRAAHWLPRWQALTRELPVHDLLDRIYAEGNVEARFAGAFPHCLRPRVRANLTRFIELALELDSGRYPSLPAFLNQLKRLYQHAPEDLNQAGDTADNSAVQILTVHAAKGLEAPVVYLADSGYKKPQARAWHALIDWPSHAGHPESFLLTGRSKDLDDWSRAQVEKEDRAEQREDANLLYVALTRARQQLIISACAHKGEQQGWYQTIATRCSDADIEADGRMILSRFGDKPAYADLRTDEIPAVTTAPVTAAALSRPFTAMALENSGDEQTLRPSLAGTERTGRPAVDSEYDTQQALERGTVIHRLLELCSPSTPGKLAMTIEQAIKHIGHELSQPGDDVQLQTWGREVTTLLKQPDLQYLFDPELYQHAINEAPLMYRYQDRFVHGIIDRLVLTEDSVIIIDYKTHHYADRGNISELAERYREQMRLYSEGVRQLWPDRTPKTLLLFTACAEALEL